MNKEKLKMEYNVDADKVSWKERENRGYKWKTSDISKNGYYINKEGNDFTVVDAKTNSVCHSTHDLSELEKERKMRIKKTIVTDGIDLYTWNRDNLHDLIRDFNNKHEKKMLLRFFVINANGFASFSLAFDGIGLALLEQFCIENNIELVKVPPLSVDAHRNLDKLMKAAKIR